MTPSMLTGIFENWNGYLYDDLTDISLTLFASKSQRSKQSSSD